MTIKKIYLLSGPEVGELKASARNFGTPLAEQAVKSLTPLEMDEAVERVAEALADEEYGRGYVLDDDLEGPPGFVEKNLDDFRQNARVALAALLAPTKEGQA